MIYPYKKVYSCKFCKRKFDVSAGFNTPRLIEHLLTEHKDIVMSEYGDLYLLDLVKKCFFCKIGERNDRRKIRIP